MKRKLENFVKLTVILLVIGILSLNILLAKPQVGQDDCNQICSYNKYEICIGLVGYGYCTGIYVY